MHAVVLSLSVSVHTSIHLLFSLHFSPPSTFTTHFSTRINPCCTITDISQCLWNHVSTWGVICSVLGKLGRLRNPLFTLTFCFWTKGIHLQNKPYLLTPRRCVFFLERTLYPFVFSSSFSHLSLTFQQYLLSPLLCTPSCNGLPLPPPSLPQSSPSISSCTYVFILAQQQVFECLFERGIAQCVTSWVNSRVDVTQPVANSPHGVRDTGLTEGWDQHHDVIRRPCDDESQQDGKDSLGHL